MDTADRYARFAEFEARGHSPCYEQWCRGIAGDAELLALIDELPRAKRQPNLVLGAARHLGVEPSEFAEFKRWLLRHWDGVAAVAGSRATQTNEAGRTAVLLPLLAALPGPLSLIEIGASAGLCLYPDRFSYRYDGAVSIDPDDGASPVVLPCVTAGNPPLPQRLPTVVHRAGVDVNPLDINDPEDIRWLESLVWPEQTHRLQRLRSVVDIARTDPPHLSRGNLVDAVPDLVRAAPADTSVVVFGSAVLGYLDRAARTIFEQRVHALPCHWISNEAVGVVESVVGRLPKAVTASRADFVLTMDGEPVAYAGPHGQSLDWFAGSVREAAYPSRTDGSE
ncbi:DUF2332 domain-containing protein [Nocardia uniformis]|uniref:DUF2332 domain-containing protein n=1 Tax=Nocardia uniformis TaxID=53432 RepID=A0A849BVG2_9NOCA|nr:DUF2332 domain-containing protein [Nocardia uniformis]NNH69078.1 DUF2332 domain-containing protein [Nocardia uniformis]